MGTRRWWLFLVLWCGAISSSLTTKNGFVVVSALSTGTSSGAVPSLTGVTLKLALDAQGGVADLFEIKSERFTCSDSLDMVHRLRFQSQAVLVGRSTVEQDDCSLTVRHAVKVSLSPQQQPMRVVVDPQLTLLRKCNEYKLFVDGLSTLVYYCSNDDCTTKILKRVEQESPSVTCVYLEPSHGNGSTAQRLTISARDIVHDLRQNRGMLHVMVEGGATTARVFLKEQMIDRAIFVRAPLYFQKPLLSHINPEVLEQAGLDYLGSAPSGVDILECWSRPNMPWPSTKLEDWP